MSTDRPPKTEPTETADPELIALDEPADGIPPLITTPAGLRDAVDRLAVGSGPIAVDAERASGIRYGQHAYLFQFHREGAGNLLIDPTAFDDLSPVQRVIANEEWIFHAASQDLACFAERGLHPDTQLFDTELAARLLGYEHVGLGSVVADTLGISLAKAHSAEDWSKRPLPDSWLAYAALDVDLLVDVRDVLAAELDEQEKTDIAREEFEAERTAEYPEPKIDAWRKIHGGNLVSTRRGKAVLRELWNAREALAEKLDRSPSRVLPDQAIVNAIVANPDGAEALSRVSGFTKGYGHSRLHTWWRAIDKARRLPAEELPQPRAHGKAEAPPVRQWAERDPRAAARLEFAKLRVAELSDDRHIPIENLMKPRVLRTALWENPADIPTFLAEHGARHWQIDLIAPIIAAADDDVSRR